MEGASCPHIHSLLSNPVTKTNFLKKYKTVVSWGVQRSFETQQPVKRRKLSSPTCGICDVTLSRPFVCLHCSFSGCWRDFHIQQHLDDDGHDFCVDAKSGAIFCRECDDFVYYDTIDNVHSAAVLAVEEANTTFQVSKRSREPFRVWVPNEKDTEALHGTVVLPCQGRRGLLNLGQTCFLNVVLQTLLANPLLRNYFLSDKHNNKLCHLKGKECTCCEMDKLFSEVYSGNESPIGPTSFLSTTWKASSELSGYAQQDAHECFISTLNQIHKTSRGSTVLSCICIVHSTFDGLLQSDVKCERCHNVTTATDPMLDISLDLRGRNGEVTGGQEATLASCLRRYTQPERLEANEYTCVKCGKGPSATKRLSIRKLPAILSFQFKRFEHKSADRTAAQKIEAAVQFPASLNMLEFTTLWMKVQEGGEKGKGHKNISASTSNIPGPQTMYDYDLYAVICHEGQIDNGHYTSFARYQDEWYHFDDDKVTHTTLGHCLKSQAYMCFYVKRHLDYKPYMTPSYVVAREAEAVKEKERELEKLEKEAARMKEVEDALLATV
ncbi:cysteine proteinase [Abortiporus biennis]|nr:cysteine proteinase [Abortiporus biennis]